MRPLPRPLQALVTWTAILPLVLGVSALVAPLTAGWPDPLRTALVITVVVPLAVFWVVPLLARTAQRMRGVPAPVVAASCPAPGVRAVVTQEACASGGAGAGVGGGAVDCGAVDGGEVSGGGIGGADARGGGIGGADARGGSIGGADARGGDVCRDGTTGGPAGAGLAREPRR